MINLSKRGIGKDRSVLINPALIHDVAVRRRDFIAVVNYIYERYLKRGESCCESQRKVPGTTRSRLQIEICFRRRFDRRLQVASCSLMRSQIELRRPSTRRKMHSRVSRRGLSFPRFLSLSFSLSVFRPRKKISAVRQEYGH